MNRAFRIDPVGPVSSYKTYEMVRPRATHSRPATCEEVGCRAFLGGWTTRVPAGSDLEAVMRGAGRTWSRSWAEPGGVTAYLFPPGTECFLSHEHRVPVDRPSIYRVRDGDWRGNPSGRYRMHTRPEDWVEDFS
ncbi:MAG: hypothetical protein PVJ28_00250, partial [Acidimicrobiia bacterium]